MTVDVIIPAYNAAATVARAIDSARAIATRIIVVDDGSDDRTAEVATAHGAEVLRQPNSGASAARAHGLRASSSEAIIYLDADDSLVADGVRQSLRMLRDDPTMSVAAGRVLATLPDGSTRLLPPRVEVDARTMLAAGFGPWPPAAQVIRASSLRATDDLAVTLVAPRYAEDYETLIRLALVGRVRQHSSIACSYSLFMGKSTRNPVASLADKERIRSHYAPVIGMRPPRTGPLALRAAAARMAFRHRHANGDRRAAGAALARAALWGATSLAAGQLRRPRGYATRAPLVVAPWLEGGGAQYSLVRILEATDVDVDVLVLFDGCRDHEPVGVAAASVTMLNAPRGAVGALWAAYRARPHLRSRPAIYSLMRGSHLVLGLTPTPLRGMRLASSFHQLPSTDEDARLAALENVPIKRFTRTCDLVTAPSDAACRELVQLGYADASRVVMVPNTISERSRPVTAPRRARSPLRLLLAGRLSHQKGIDRLPELLDGVPVQVVLRVAGAGELEHVVRRLALDREDVEHVGRVDDMTEQYDWCDAVLMPSRFELNPIVVWEAWASGRPVVASRIDVLEDLAEHGPVLTFGDRGELADVLVSLADVTTAQRLHREALEAFATRRSSLTISTFLSARADPGVVART